MNSILVYMSINNSNNFKNLFIAQKSYLFIDAYFPFSK